jgi:hypothetical protein
MATHERGWTRINFYIRKPIYGFSMSRVPFKKQIAKIRVHPRPSVAKFRCKEGAFVCAGNERFETGAAVAGDCPRRRHWGYLKRCEKGVKSMKGRHLGLSDVNCEEV